MYTIPTVLEKKGNTERAYDLYSRMLEDRIMFLSGEVREENMSILSASALFLDNQDAEKPIWLYINSPGGSVTDGLMLADVLTYVKSPICTVIMGQAASMGLVLGSMKYTHKPASRRYILPNARMMAHQVSSGTKGLITDQMIALKEAEKLNEKLMNILAENTGKSVKQIKKDADRDFWLSAQEAVEYGFVDEILTTAVKKV
jgi:ATP-dependent Clp protease protease subunit